MIEGNQYIETVKKYFSFLISEFGFKVTEEEIRGNAFYDIQYKDKARIVSISYENIEDYLQVIVCILQNGELPYYDDKSKTLHLKHLNKLVMSYVTIDEIKLNSMYFVKYNAESELEKRLLKEAKGLRLCLKNYNEIQNSKSTD